MTPLPLQGVTNDDDREVNCPVCNKEETNYWIKQYGMCFYCHAKEETEKDKKRECEQAVKDGEASSEHGIICPYCGYLDDVDCHEYGEEADIDCSECGKKFHLTTEYTATYYTEKIKKVKSK